MIENDINNVKVGDIFSTKGALRKKLGFAKTTKPDLIKYQDKEIERYLTYKKTGKMSRGKETNEIIITEIYDIPKEKIDNRKNNKGHGSFCYLLKDCLLPLLYATKNKDYKGYYKVNELMSLYGFSLIPNETYVKKEKYDFYSNIYKREFENEFIIKMKTACSSLAKDYNEFTWRYTYLINNDTIVDEKTYKDIIQIYNDARVNTCACFSYSLKNFNILMAKKEDANEYYNSYINERLHQIGLNINKRQKIFILEWSEDISILESKHSDYEYIENIIEKQGILFNLFKNRMGKVLERLINYYSEIKDDAKEEFDMVHYYFWDWINDPEYTHLRYCG